MTIATDFENDKISFVLPENVSANILDTLIVTYRNVSELQSIDINFSKVKYIDIEGAVSVICFFASLKQKNKRIKFNLTYPIESVFSYLLTLGFFGQLITRLEIIEGQTIISYEKNLIQERKIKQKINSFKIPSNPIILPIEIIQQKQDWISGSDFESMLGTFVNQAMNSLEAIRESPFYNFDGKDYYSFRESNVELYKNIFQHSKSWGLTTIHARPKYGTTVCYYDIGIGFKESIGLFKSDEEAIKWALIDGHTSKPEGDNDGFGLTLVQDFVFERNGAIKIRSGSCLLQITSSGIKTTTVPFFPGAQISFFVPFRI